MIGLSGETATFVTRGPACRMHREENEPILLCRSKNHGVTLVIMSGIAAR